MVEEKEKLNLSQRERYHNRKEAHCCVRCGCALPEDYHFISCIACREIIRINVARVKKRRHKQNLCERCGKKAPMEGALYCIDCANKQRERIDACHKQRICSQCGESLPEDARWGTCEICRLKKRESSARNKLKRVEQGICILCGKDFALPDKKYCLSCLEQHKSAKKKLEDAYRCVNCGTPLSENYPYKMCEACAEKARFTAAEHRRKAIEEGFCSRCFKHPVVAGFILCQDCLDKRIGKKQQEQEAKRFCSACKTPLEEGSTRRLCEKCREKRATLLRLERAREEHQLCARCRKVVCEAGRTYCSECAKMISDKTKQLRMNRQEQHCCRRCGVPLPEDYKFNDCPSCSQKRHAYFKRRREEAIAKGYCGKCFIRPAKAGIQLCELCAEQHRKSMHRKKKEKNE